jgi:carboxypeptidase Q
MLGTSPRSVLCAAVTALAAADFQYQLITNDMTNVANQLISASQVNTTAYERLGYLADTFGPRFSGTQAVESALDWLVSVAQSDGFTVTQQPVNVPRWVRGNEWAKMVSPRNKTLHFTGLGMSNNTGGQVITAPVFVVSSYAELMQNATQAKGCIVLFNAIFTSYGQTVQYRMNAAVWAASVGAVGALIRSVGPYGIQTPHTGASQTGPIAAGAVSMEDASQMQRMQSRGQAIVVSLYMEAQQLPDSPSRNVIIDWPGSELPSEYVVMGGHSDSWDIAEGAMDDGGGIITTLEALRLIKAIGLRPRRTVRVVFWVNEENGGAGGDAYASGFANTLNSTSIAIETDDGAFSPWTLSFYGHDAAFNQLLLLAPLLDPLAAGNVTRTTGPPGSDIAPTCTSSANFPCGGISTLDPRSTPYANNPCLGFANGQPPAAQNRISDGYFWFHHSGGDTLDRMDPFQLQTVAATLAVWTATIANLPVLLPRSGPVPPMPAPPSGITPGALAAIICSVAAVAAAIGGVWYLKKRGYFVRYSRRAAVYDPTVAYASIEHAGQTQGGA